MNKKPTDSATGSATESVEQFESRKQDHIRWALDASTQVGRAGFERLELLHEALPELNFADIDISEQILGHRLRAPLLVSSMTAGHQQGIELNRRMARAVSERGWAMGVGSQRRELTDPAAKQEWRDLRKQIPKAILFGNIGIAQIIETPVSTLQGLVENLSAQALIVHLNPLQECLQPEGTPQFRGGLLALEKLTKRLSVPVVVKETGCGISGATVARLLGTGVAAVDVSGLGGTHWGRIEGHRAPADSAQAKAAQTFAGWGITTVESLFQAVNVSRGQNVEIWGSGGVRNGLDVAKALAIGAKLVGIAKPVIEAAQKGEQALDEFMSQIEFELRVALFCTGSLNLGELKQKRVWRWLPT